MNLKDGIIIVGTGPSSLFLTTSLLERRPELRIIVLEAGLEKFDESTPLGPRSSIAQPFKLSPTINIGYGGSSQLWHNVLAPLDKEDFLERSWIQGSGWPISRDDIESSYEKVASFFGFSHSLFSSDNPVEYFDSLVNAVSMDRSIFRPKIFLQPRRYLRAGEDN